MRIRLTDRIKAFFSSDEEAYWFNHFTDEEKALSRMDVWELAKVINEARVHNLASDAEKLIVAEYMLNQRLAKIQAKASWGSGVIGAIIGASLSIALAPIIQNQNEVQGRQENTATKQAIATPEKQALKPILDPIKSMPVNLRANIPAIEIPVKSSPYNAKKKQNKNAPANP